jgi:catechol 2,3-dioxygenase-like lactoylglutathione lyase family enzyme
MLHHVGIEVAPADLKRMVEFWTAVGFAEVEPPPSLAEFIWLEKDRTQIHLMPTDRPTVPARGHVAVVATDFEDTVSALRASGFDVEPRRKHWGAARVRALAPGGHRVELMANPPGR